MCIRDRTTALQAAPLLGLQSLQSSSIGQFVIGQSAIQGTGILHSQLVKDTVRVTTYGVRNAQILGYLDYVLNFSVNYDTLGIMNMPVVHDEKRVQAEQGILAQKKTIEFEVSYYQQAVENAAIQYILSSIPTFYIGPLVAN